MSSFLWLLLYLAPLLGLTAAVFAWFGWQWWGHDMRQRIKDLEAQIDDAQTALRNVETNGAPQPDAQLLTLRDELKSAQTELRRDKDNVAKANEAVQALETEAARLLRDLDVLRAERDQANTALATAQTELTQLRSTAPTDRETAAPASAPVGPEVPAKPKRKRSTTPKPKVVSTASPASIRGKTSALETQLAAHQPTVATLIQERDGWQRRVDQLEKAPHADPAGLGLARRSLADSDKRLLIATTEIERLQRQARVLQRAEEKAAALAEVADDDLTQIKGIKKVIRDQLHSHGIRTWRQIAQWDNDELNVFSELLAFKNRATREKWQEQARSLHEAAHGPLP